MLDAEGLRRLFLSEVRKAESQTAWAQEHGVSVAYVNDIIHRRKHGAVPDAIAKALGYERTVRYKRRK